MADAAVAEEQLLTLLVGDQRVAVPTAMIREVTRLPRITRVPHAPAALIGLGNIRGTVVPMLSLATLLDRPGGAEARVVIVEDDELVGLAVDGVARMGNADGARPIDVAALIAGVVTSSVTRQARSGAVTEARDVAQDDRERLSLLVFALGKQEFALPLTAVDEVLRLPETIARMPHGDAVVVGSMSVRGALLPLLSLRALLAFPAAEETARARIIVVRIGAHRVGLVVDAMRSTLSVGEDTIDPVPQVLTRGSAEARIQAICRLDHGKRLVSILATEHLLRDDITARLFQSGEVDKIGETAVEEASEQFLLFRIGGEEFGMPVAAVEEVAPLPPKLTRLPKAPPFVQGMMNLRGAVVPVIDQAQRFGAAAAASDAKRRVVVVRIGDLQAGFVVDAVSEVLRVPASALRPAPELGSAETRVFERVANLADEDRIVLIVSPRELLDRAEQDLLRGMAAAS